MTKYDKKFNNMEILPWTVPPKVSAQEYPEDWLPWRPGEPATQPRGGPNVEATWGNNGAHHQTYRSLNQITS